MSTKNAQDGLVVEDEKDETPYVEFDISVSPSDPTLELLSQQIKNGDVIIPFYQRKYVWSIEQASKLIESFLMGLPIPQIFLYINAENQLEVIDGQQRLMSVKYFFDEYFGEPDKNGRQKVFYLKGLSERSEYNGKKFSQLSERDKRKLRNSTLRAINVRQLKPKGDNESVFYIFERLNTGGTRLKPQEIRNAVYRGNIVTELRSLNENKHWMAILGLKQPDKNQKDVELVLRIFSLFEQWRNYEKPMLQFLNKKMDENRDFSSQRALKFKSRFPIVAKLIAENLKKPFRPKGVINSAFLEAVFITLLENSAIDSNLLEEKYSELEIDPEFERLIRGATTDTITLKDRINRANKVFLDAITSSN